jgi:uncharacterized protein (TIGR03067 family)
MGRLPIAFVVCCFLVSSNSFTKAGDDAKPLQGVWIAQSMEADGKPAPADAVKRMKFTFTDDKLLIAGNFADDREQECAYKVDPKRRWTR